MDTVVNPNEVLFYGTRYPLWGGVRRTGLSPFPPKYTIGNYSRDDKVLESTWVQDDWSGGLGILNAKLPQDADRYWDGNLHSPNKHLCLGAEVIQASTLGPAVILIDYNEKLYAVVNDQVYRWNQATVDLEPLLAHPGTDLEPVEPCLLNSECVAANVFNGQLVFQCTEAMYLYDGSANIWLPIEYDEFLNPFAPGGVAAIVWDDKYFLLRNDNVMTWITIPSAPESLFTVFSTETEWTEAGRLQLPNGYCNQLIIYFDLNGEATIHAVTKVGVFGYDFAAHRFRQTALTFPFTQTAGKGATVHRGELIVPAGAAVYVYNGSTIQTRSPARDDGLPEGLRGDVIQMVSGHGFLYAVVDVDEGTDEGASISPNTITFFNDTVEDTPDLYNYPADPLTTYPIQEGITRGAILMTPNSSWHVVDKVDSGYQMGAAIVAYIEGYYRLWFSSANGLFYVELSKELFNPLQNPNRRFKETGYLESAWTDLGWPEMDKLAFELDIEADQITADETITFSIAWDNSPVWQEVGTVTQNGQTIFSVGPDEGFKFRSVRIRIEMKRGSDSSKTPVLMSCILTFLRRPARLKGYQFVLQLTDDYEGLSAEEMIQRLEAAEDDVYAGEFVYYDRMKNENKRFMAVVSSLSSAEVANVNRGGRYTVSIVGLPRGPE